jgi:hypothetical protein
MRDVCARRSMCGRTGYPTAMAQMELSPGARWMEMVERVRSLPSGTLGREELLCEGFLLAREGALEVFWIPFEGLNRQARIAIIGLTPGWSQMQEAFADARDVLAYGQSDPR